MTNLVSWTTWATSFVAWHANKSILRGWTCHANLMNAIEYKHKAKKKKKCKLVDPHIIINKYKAKFEMNIFTSSHFTTNQFWIFPYIRKRCYRYTPIGYWTPKVSTNKRWQYVSTVLIVIWIIIIIIKETFTSLNKYGILYSWIVQTISYPWKPFFFFFCNILNYT